MTATFDPIQLADYATEMISLHDEDGRFLTSSSVSRDVLGTPAEDLVGRRLSDLVHPEDARALETAFDGVPGEPRPGAVGATCRLRHADGYWTWTEITVRRRPGTSTGQPSSPSAAPPSWSPPGSPPSGLRRRCDRSSTTRRPRWRSSAWTVGSSGSTRRSARCSTPPPTNWSAVPSPVSPTAATPPPTGSPSPSWPAAGSTTSPGRRCSCAGGPRPGHRHDPPVDRALGHRTPERGPARPRRTRRRGRPGRAGRPRPRAERTSAGPPGSAEHRGGPRRAAAYGLPPVDGRCDRADQPPAAAGPAAPGRDAT